MIPTVERLKSDRLVHKFGDVFAPPGLTNFHGVCQADLDITAISSLNFPPFTNSTKVTASLYLDDCYFAAHNCPIAFTWYPDKIVRETEYNGLKLSSTTILPFGKTAVIIKLCIENTAQADRDVKIKFATAAHITKNMDTGKVYIPPFEEDHKITIEPSRRAVIFAAVHSEACSVQGMYPLPHQATGFGLEKTLSIPAGGKSTVFYLHVIGDTPQNAIQQFDRLAHDQIENLFSETEQQWNEQIAAAFTPGNSQYAGCLPTLYTDDPDIYRLYYTAALGVIYFRRDNPFSVYGRAYDTLMPRYWQGTTFIWDYFLSSGVHALLDPEVMKKYLELWMQTDVHSHFGTEYLTGGTVGPWYAVNDFALVWMANDYLRWNGDFSWLDKNIGASGKSIIAYLKEYAINYRQFKTANGLADYGGINNLLECVSTYIHEVASLNAGNVFSLRALARILDRQYHDRDASAYAQEAEALVQEVMKLYSHGNGYWNTRFPDGSRVEVRHGYDFMTILQTLHQDLDERQKEEMVQFFVHELQTPVWMRALSPKDPNAMFSVRPDHQWNGAYTAWPALAAAGLYRIKRGELAFPWLKGIARSANQGPFAQCHFVESAMPPDSGGALKAYYEWPYGADWACSSSGSYITAIIEGIFGVSADAYAGITARPQFCGFDAKAELHYLRYQNEYYQASINGLTKTK